MDRNEGIALTRPSGLQTAVVGYRAPLGTVQWDEGGEREREREGKWNWLQSTRWICGIRLEAEPCSHSSGINQVTKSIVGSHGTFYRCYLSLSHHSNQPRLV